ncbi:hypothetical protein GGI12_002924 [Dipsacomyces acuminosporus]|nr:hypothetical protein GGI12_002924 [Dipsacomyces acuminosporus]
MSARSTAVEEAQADIHEHAQTVLGELGSLAQESSGGSELKDMLMRVAKQTAALDSVIKDTQQTLSSAQSSAARLADRIDDTNEQWKSLAKTIDIVKVSSSAL